MSTVLHFDTEFSFEKSIHILKELSAQLLGEHHVMVDSIGRGDFSYLANYSPDYEESRSALLIRKERQVAAFFQKNAALPLKIDRSMVALKKFLETEEVCRKMNMLLRSRDTLTHKVSVDGRLYFEVSRKIAEILGPCPSLDELPFGFGPGANVGLSRLTSVRRKLSALPTCTANAWKYCQYLQEAYPHWENLKKVQPAMHGRLAFVPKNAKTDRSIVVEPLINTFLQKGVGGYIRERLKRFNCDLNTNQAKNQLGALRGSRDGSLATIDLSSASDTISREVVAAVLPYDWWVLLEDFRTHSIRLPDGREVILQKFSSMGNGFTFELETLIFYAIALVVCPKGSFVSVHGDDIVVPTSHFNVMQYALNQFGFSVNPDKSFGSGVFRESCGKDYFGGVDVRPCYVKGLLSVKELFRLHNFFVRDCDEELAGMILKHIPKRFRIYGPDGFGDGHLLGDYDRSVFNKRRGWSGHVFRTYQAKPFRRCEPLNGDYAAILFQCTDRLTSGDDENLPYIVSRIPLAEYRVNERPIVSSTMYQERNNRPRYRLARIYTLG